jgi:hypothetical protein
VELKEKHKSWLEQQLTAKSTELLELKKTHSNQVMELKVQLTDTTTKAQRVEQQLNTANQDISDLVSCDFFIHADCFFTSLYLSL